ncbi:MAG TPA: homoserine kinase [Acidobacteriaceae bacterium]|nr:homoserine kinase [Acidobacteriaceae bacterium]
MREVFHLKLPATSANLGPAFDTAAVALNLHLEIQAEAASDFTVSATGRDAVACGRMEGNLILQLYRHVLTLHGKTVVPLRLGVRNGIPLGMGCGSSAAARLAGIAIAAHFGALDLSGEEIVALAAHLEGHPDNVSACWFGGMTVSAVAHELAGPVPGTSPPASVTFPRVSVARFDVSPRWRPVLVLPREAVRTEESRKVLPGRYSQADTVVNLQHTALLVAAFATGDSSLLRSAMHDRLHHPYRSAICPLLPRLQEISPEEGLLGVALSGAGPGVFMVVERSLNEDLLQRLLRHKLGGLDSVEVMVCEFENQGKASRVDRW